MKPNFMKFIETQVIKCGCQTDAQDRRWGAFRRLHNKTERGWKCTSCGHLKPHAKTVR